MERFVHEGMSLGSCDTVSGKESQIFNETGVKGRIGEILKKKGEGVKLPFQHSAFNTCQQVFSGRWVSGDFQTNL